MIWLVAIAFIVLCFWLIGSGFRDLTKPGNRETHVNVHIENSFNTLGSDRHGRTEEESTEHFTGSTKRW